MNDQIPPPENLIELLADLVGMTLGFFGDPFNVLLLLCFFVAGVKKLNAVAVFAGTVCYALIATFLITAMLQKARLGVASPIAFFGPVIFFQLGYWAGRCIPAVGQRLRGKPIEERSSPADDAAGLDQSAPKRTLD